MKKIAYLLFFLTLGAGVYAAGAHLSGGAWPTFGLPLGGAMGDLRQLCTSYWEDIQFKDFKKAAQYHDPSVQEAVDIPYLLERTFLQKPEFLDLMEYEVVFVDIDSTGLRGRARTRVRIKDLMQEKVRDQEVMLYFKRKSTAEPWYMDLETSLRSLEGEEGKKH
jgi:hypothetical protein